MRRNQRAALLALLNREMLKRGSWCGETHIQKATFFLAEDLLGVKAPISISFSIDTGHSRLCFRDDLSSMQADDLLDLTVRLQGYGPTYMPTAFSETYLKRFPVTTARYAKEVESLCLAN